MTLHTKPRKAKSKNTAKTRQLAKEWEALVAHHARPLERGAKSKGVQTKAIKVETRSLSPSSGSRIVNNPGLSIRSVKMSGAATKAIPAEDLQRAIHQVSSRVGMSYNKGGLQYLTDDELNEQRLGVHKRRS